MTEKKLLVNNHDARCIEWYRRLIADGTAEDGQRIAVQMHDEAMRIQSENTHLKAERDKAVEDMKTINHQDMNGIINMCKFCKYGFDKTCAKCCVDNWTNKFEWRGLEETK